MKTRTVVISVVVAVLLIGGAFLFGLVAALISSVQGGGVHHGFWGGDNIGLITVEGSIYESKDTIEQIEEFRKDDSIKAIILRVNSPGGSVAASQEIMQAASKASQEKPVIASMGTVAASGGYYLSLGATEIIANPGTITGSIGVRLDHLMLRDLLRWAKIQHETLKSGKFKDIGTFDRPLTAEERNLLQGMLEDIHLQFKEAVAQKRKLDLEQVDKIADGRVFTGRVAYELKLVDELGGFTEAVERAKELGKIKGDPEIVEPRRFKYEWIGGILESAIRGLYHSLQDLAGASAVRLPLYQARI